MAALTVKWENNFRNKIGTFFEVPWRTAFYLLMLFGNAAVGCSSQFKNKNAVVDRKHLEPLELEDVAMCCSKLASKSCSNELLKCVFIFLRKKGKRKKMAPCFYFILLKN